MLPLEDGGVVSPKLQVCYSFPKSLDLPIKLISNRQVYGTANIRVVDISIIPLHIGSHMQCEDVNQNLGT
jgi:hypothetical protein